MNKNPFFTTVAGLLLATCASAAAAQGAAATAARPAASRQAPAQAGPDAIFTALDTNKDQALSLQEFQAGYAGLARAIALEVRLREQFRAGDADHSGAIDAGEYATLALIKRAGKAAPALSAFDTNNDQKLAFGEYLAVVRKLAAPPAPAVEKK